MRGTTGIASRRRRSDVRPCRRCRTLVDVVSEAAGCSLDAPVPDRFERVRPVRVGGRWSAGVGCSGAAALDRPRPRPPRRRRRPEDVVLAAAASPSCSPGSPASGPAGGVPIPGAPASAVSAGSSVVTGFGPPPRPRPPRRRRLLVLEPEPAPPFDPCSTPPGTRSTSPGCASRSTSGSASVVPPATVAWSFGVPAGVPAPERPLPPRPRPPRLLRRRVGAAWPSAGTSLALAPSPPAAVPPDPDSSGPFAFELGRRVRGAGASGSLRGVRARRGRAGALGSVGSCCWPCSCTGAGAVAPGPCGASLRTLESSSGGPPGRAPPGLLPGPAKPAPRLSSSPERPRGRVAARSTSRSADQHSNRRLGGPDAGGSRN